MRALLLAAGLGTRLRPLTNYLPKCLVPIHGRPLLDYWLETGERWSKRNSHQYPLSCFTGRRIFKKKRMVAMGDSSSRGKTSRYWGNHTKNRAFFKNEPFIVAHADNLTIFDMPVRHSPRFSTDGCRINHDGFRNA